MINDVVCLDLSSAWNEKQNESWNVISVSDALIKSLNNRGCVDIRYISELTGKSPDMVIDYLKGSIYLISGKVIPLQVGRLPKNISRVISFARRIAPLLRMSCTPEDLMPTSRRSRGCFLLRSRLRIFISH